jgi:hypothetical protein
VKQLCVLRQFIVTNDNQTWGSWGFYVKLMQVNHDGESGKKEREREGERKIWGERESNNTVIRENGVG